MVKLDKVDKFFFRRKKNEIHAINNTSLELNGNQLVALLGPSGCGKTTLLNAIGGLDKVSKGKIFVDGERITSRFSGKVDKIRTLKIGYIFQNYNLIDSMTVFDNVAIALRMVGEKDKEKIKEKVNYILDKVGMYRYRNRYADMLSGGERQRVGIARALVKNPQIIIADEPTGNLDSKNTLEVMSIIKSISKERLVILVTHEEELANYYADRIIKIRDGKVVSDEINSNSNELNYRIDNRIYLHDIEDHQRLNTGRYVVDFYNKNGNVGLDIVVDGKNIYIKSKEPDANVEIVDDNSAYEIIDGSYAQSVCAESKSATLDLGKLKRLKKGKYASIFNPITILKFGFKSVSNYPILKKVLLAGFFLSATVITFSTCMLFGVFQVSDAKFATSEKDYIVVGGKNFDASVYESYENNKFVKYIIPGTSQVAFKLVTNDLYQTKNESVYIKGSLSDVTNLKKSDIIAGRVPQSRNEIIVDKLTLEKTINDVEEAMFRAKQIGYDNYSKFLGKQVTVENLDPFTIVGIVDKERPCIYAYNDQFINIVSNTDGTGDMDEMYESDDMLMDDMGMSDGDATLVNSELKKDLGLFEGGRWPENNYEILTNYWLSKDDKEMKIGKEINQKVNGHKLLIVGYYTDKNPNSSYYVTTPNTIKLSVIEKNKKATIRPIDGHKNDVIEMIEADGYKVTDQFESDREKYFKKQKSLMKAVIIFSGIVLLISFIEIFLMVRASFLSRIKEVGTYRAIGVKKKDIYRMFSGEIIAITIIASLPGFALSAIALKQLSQNALYGEHFMVNPNTLALSLMVIIALNVVFGLIPVWKTIRKTPSNILSRADLS